MVFLFKQKVYFSVKIHYMNFDERYKELNKQQKEAVDNIEGPLLVVAGPGSGKTEILSLRVGKILKESQILASNILCLTFTDAASLNMRNRLTKLIGQEGYRVAIHTFHNFCVEIIQKHPEYFYSGAFFSPANELTQIQILQEIFDTLPHKNPLSSLHPEQGFVYLKDSLYLIQNFKKAGIEPETFKQIIEHNTKVLPKINESIKKIFTGGKLNQETVKKAETELNKIKNLSEKTNINFPSLLFEDLSKFVYESLKKSVDESKNINKTTPLSKWKDSYTKKNDIGENVLKDTLYIEKLISFSDIYFEYRKLMFEKGYYDFDDMILDCKIALQKNPSLRYEIQEQYQYILVDEFQDTNGAQMEILKLITDSPVNEGKPNIMVVGDDDQAIYKFQGAEISNILNFKKMFKDVKQVTMTQNYRSTQEILDIAREIIIKGEERLEKMYPEIEKKLSASNKNIEKGNIKHKEFLTNAHENNFIAKEIRKKIDNGENPEEIAIIGRKHKQLEEMVPYLKAQKIDIRYEREQNIFKEPHISQLILISKFINSLINKYQDEADEYLPEILSFPFWKLRREDIWKISLEARKKSDEKTWLEVMLESENKQIKNIANFLIELGVKSQNEPLEKILDSMIGAHVPLSEEDPDADVYESEQIEKSDNKKFNSPFKNFYFSKEKFEKSKSEYLSFLSSLRVFINSLREYKTGEVLSIKDLVEFVDLYEKNNISLNDQSPFSRLKGAVNLITAHGAKGLEFDTVFVLSCQDDIWAGRGVSSKIPSPLNLQITPGGDTDDDKLRLFYVAITRAKRFLYLTSYQTKDDGKDAKKLRFLVSESEYEEGKNSALKCLYCPEKADTKEEDPETHEVLTASWMDYRTTPFIGSERKILETLIDEYKLSVTHLNNFLNIEKGGPQFFLEQNLLRFPQSKTNSSSFGTAIHRTLENFIISYKKNGVLPKIEDTVSCFKKFLRKERMIPSDYKKYEEKGIESIKKFIKEKSKSFKLNDIVEFNFRDQNVIVNEAHINGKIDRIVDVGDNELEVHDYKTGKAPINDWEGKEDYEKTKLYEYERQLIFYKLLVENSREFSGKKKVSIGILDFVEPRKNDNEIVSLSMKIDKEKTDRLKNIISIVYKKIINLDFPDISKYSKGLKGIKEFEDDLLEGKI